MIDRCNRLPPCVANIALTILLCIQVVISIKFLFTVPQGDEALHIYNSLRVAHGQFPYINFFSYLTPGTYLLGGFAGMFVHQQILATRLLMMIFSVATLWFIYRVVAMSWGKNWALVFTSLYLCTTALSSTIFSHHNVHAFLFSFAIYLVSRINDSRKSWLTLGTVIAADAFVHQAQGFYLFAATILWVIIGRTGSKWEKLGCIIIPSVVSFSAFCALLLLSNGLDLFINQAVLWNIVNYGGSLAFGFFEDNMYHLSLNKDVIEQYFMIAAKILIIFLVLRILWRLQRPKNVQFSGGLVAVVTLTNFAGNVQTMHSWAAYTTVVVLAIGLLSIGERPRVLLVLCIFVLIIQIVRVMTFPVRYATFYLNIGNQLEYVGNEIVLQSEYTQTIKNLSERTKSLGIQKVIVLGRSPELYILGRFSNPTMFDIILPVYLSRNQLSTVEKQLIEYPVIYDGTLEKLANPDGFFDHHHYSGKRYEEIRQWNGWSIAGKDRVREQFDNITLYRQNLWSGKNKMFPQ